MWLPLELRQLGRFVGGWSLVALREFGGRFDGSPLVDRRESGGLAHTRLVDMPLFSERRGVRTDLWLLMGRRGHGVPGAVWLLPEVSHIGAL